VTVEEPLLTVDRQMGLNIVHPDGKVHSGLSFSLRFAQSIALQYAKTTFRRMFYDEGTNTSVLHCGWRSFYPLPAFSSSL
jgi:tRNA pseudouridine32 synthase